MSVFIWIACLLIYPITAAVLRMNGILLGGIPTGLLVAGSIALAKFLSGCVGKPSKKKEAESKAPASAAANAPDWQCECGRRNADYVMTCACGITKKEMKLRNAADKNSTV